MSSVTVTFAGPDAPTLGVDWTIINEVTGFNITDNLAQPDVYSGTNAVGYNALILSKNQYVEVVCGGSPYTAGVLARAKFGLFEDNGYLLISGVGAGGTVLCTFHRAGPGVITINQIVIFSALIYAVHDDVLRIETEDVSDDLDSDVTIRAYINGVQVGSDYIDSIFKFQDNIPGISGQFNTGYDAFSSFSAGDLHEPPPPVVVTSGYVTSLSFGPQTTLTQNTEYALPVRAGLIHSTAALEISLDRLTWTALTNADTVGTKVAGGFIRCPGGTAVVTIKRFRGF